MNIADQASVYTAVKYKQILDTPETTTKIGGIKSKGKIIDLFTFINSIFINSMIDILFPPLFIMFYFTKIPANYEEYDCFNKP